MNSDVYERVMILAPHPDDEIVGCGGAILLHTEQGAEVRVLYFHGKERAQEAANGMGILGVTDDKLFFASKDGLSFLRNHVKKFNPDLIYFPHLYDRHEDHHKLALLARQILKADSYGGALRGYGVWHPIYEPNVLIEITGGAFSLKLMAMRYHASQVKDFDLEGLCKSLNHLYYLRDMNGKREDGYAEAFLSESL